MMADLIFPTYNDESGDPYDSFLAYKLTHQGEHFAGVVPLTFGRARIVIGEGTPTGYSDVW